MLCEQVILPYVVRHGRFVLSARAAEQRNARLLPCVALAQFRRTISCLMSELRINTALLMMQCTVLRRVAQHNVLPLHYCHYTIAITVATGVR